MLGQGGEGDGQPRLPADHEVSGADNRGRAKSGDFRELYAHSRGIRGASSTRSMSSFTTEWSNATEPVSNTTESRVEKKKQKQRFLVFTKTLMKFLERRDPSVYNKAQNVIRDCDDKKKLQHPGYESLTESVRTPLKEVVGPSYWKQARRYLKKAVAQLPAEEIEPLSPSEDLPTFSPSELACLEQSFLNPEEEVEARAISFPTFHSPVDPIQVERRLRKQRFWMLVRVLMRYLEHKDYDMYIEAKETIQDCIKRDRRREHGYRSLTKVIRVSLERVVGDHYWRRAKTYLGHILKKEADDEEYEAEQRELRRRRRRSKIVEAHLAWLARESNNGVGDMGDEPHTAFDDPVAIPFDEYDAKGIADSPALIHDVEEDLLVRDQVLDGLDPTWNPNHPVDEAESQRSQQLETWPAILGQNEGPLSPRYTSEKRPWDVECCRKVELSSASLRLGAVPSGGACINRSGTSHGRILTGLLNSSRLSHVSLALEAAVDEQDCYGPRKPRKRLRLEGSFSSIASPAILEGLENVVELPSNIT
jgi:hypothetical protein